METIIKALKNNKVGIIPTETVLGLCTTFDNTTGIQKIYELKQRPLEKKLSIIFENFEQIKNNFDIDFDRKFKLLAWHFWPGPLTIIIKDKQGQTWGFRKPNNEIALYILSHLEKPLVCTSVNITNKPPLELVSKIDNHFKNNIDFIINSDADGERSSTVYDLENDVILRNGPISYEQIQKVLKND